MRRTPLALSILTLLSAAAATRYPLTIPDDSGRRLTFNAEPQRMRAVLPSHTGTPVAIGTGDTPVPVGRNSTHPVRVVAPLPTVVSADQPNLESVVALTPDLILADDSAGSRPTEQLVPAETHPVKHAHRAGTGGHLGTES